MQLAKGQPKIFYTVICYATHYCYVVHTVYVCSIALQPVVLFSLFVRMEGKIILPDLLFGSTFGVSFIETQRFFYIPVHNHTMITAPHTPCFHSPSGGHTPDATLGKPHSLGLPKLPQHCFQNKQLFEHQKVKPWL